MHCIFTSEYTKTKENFALKILNPLGYKLVSPTVLRRCTVIVKGKSYEDSQPLCKENVWWLLNGSTKQYLTAYYSEQEKSLRELSLKQCVAIWGSEHDCSEGNQSFEGVDVVMTDTGRKYVPTMPPKFVDFVKRRARIFREITNMRKISNHQNVIRLQGVLELVQESKCTIFLVMELANGGELFDRIKLDCGTREDTAKEFFSQLLDGVRHCHEQGVCHRDLKPENLLLTDGDGRTVLKIADFGFSARFAMAADMKTNMEEWGASSPAPSLMSDPANVGLFLQSSPQASIEETRALTSVVGSPFYVAPEILQAKGYSGPKADVWSIGVILYAILAGNLPFGQELVSCKRFKHFCKWIKELPIKNSGTEFWGDVTIDYPEWLFPAKFSVAAKGLIIGMLHPDPSVRVNVQEAQKHPWCNDTYANYEASMITNGNDANIQGNNDDDDNKNNEMSAPVLSYTESDMQIEEDDVDDEQADDTDGLFKMEEEDDHSSSRQPRQQFQQEQQQQPYIPAVNIHDGTNVESVLPTSFVGSPATRSVYMSSPAPPLAPDTLATAQADILADVYLEESRDNNRADAQMPTSQVSAPLPTSAWPTESEFITPSGPGVPIRSSSSQVPPSSSQAPPSFSDLVKRSTRFITSVPAYDVLQKLSYTLEGCCSNNTMTAIGVIGRVHLILDAYRIEVWGSDVNGPPIMALQVYQMPSNSTGNNLLNSPGRSSSHHAPLSRRESTSEHFLVEFIRGQLDIFAFKRFYQWCRQHVEDLVKKDFTTVNFEAGSPSFYTKTT